MFCDKDKDAPSGQWVQAVHKTTVGASLLAKALGQSTTKSTDKPHSRAGSLPQGTTGQCQIIRGDDRGSS
ncbi:hypothetical protein C1X64_22790 [Pseudomonas sp. GW456-E7]|nr:hypothetical protein C1X64_22790 [Pseudomonas sp. GW456-E7]